ncbi:MAG: ABC transporter permease [Ktedonobacteraceae bacterium]
MLRAFVRAVWTICKKDIRVWLRQPANVAITVLPALALLFIDALSAGAVGLSPVALVTLDHGIKGQQMAQVIHQADLFRVSDATPAQARALYQNLDVVAILTIPANFTRAIEAHQPTHIEVQINNLNADFTNDIRRAVPDAITQLYQQQGGESPIKVTLQEQNLRSQDIQLFQYSAMPLLVLLLVISGLVSSSLSAAGEWETRTIKELLLSPASSGAIITGKVLTGFATTMTLGVLVLGVGDLLGWVQPEGVYWLSVLLILALVALFSAGLGVALGALLQRIQPVSSAAIVIALYLFFLTGGTAVLAFDPVWLQTIATFVPLYYGRHALEMAIFYHSSDQLGRDSAVLAGSALLAVGLGILAMRRGIADSR